MMLLNSISTLDFWHILPFGMLKTETFFADMQLVHDVRDQILMRIASLT